LVLELLGSDFIKEVKMVIEFRPRKVALDPVTQSPIVLLVDLQDRKMIPIWLGHAEANAIFVAMEHIQAPRPMTHDLMKNALGELGATLLRIEINDLKDSTYYATMYLKCRKTVIGIDSRPSDAIALALRFAAPIYVTEEVLSKTTVVDLTQEIKEGDRLLEILKSLEPDDFGKYKM